MIMKESIFLYDLQGKQVILLANNNYGIGYHQIDWDATGYSTGIYFVKMSVGNSISTKKVVLVK